LAALKATGVNSSRLTGKSTFTIERGGDEDLITAFDKISHPVAEMGERASVTKSRRIP
jgi:hypothetical protein